MPILNYTTTIAAEKSIEEIQGILASPQGKENMKERR